jgi:P27 family predicted phage terminase small subunit
MGLRGPKKQPAALAMLRGTYRGDRYAQHQALPLPELPSCPPHLGDEAKREWRRVGKELLACGLISKIDRAALAAYCQCWARWVEAETQLKTGGLMTLTPHGYPQPSPWLAVANKSLEQLRAFGSEFDLSPSGRSRVEALPMPRANEQAKNAKRRLLFGDDTNTNKLSKYLRTSEEQAAMERRFFGGDDAA